MKLLNFEDTRLAFISKTDKDLIKKRLLFESMKLPWLVNLGTRLINASIKIKLPVKKLIKVLLFDQFCGGQDIEDTSKTIEVLHKYKVTTILDYSVEGESSEKSFNDTLEEFRRVISFSKMKKEISFCVVKLTGLGAASLFEKRQSGLTLTNEESNLYQKFLSRIELLAEEIYHSKLRLLIDAEESWIQDEIDCVAIDLMHKYNTKEAVIFNTYQLYKHAGFESMIAHFKEVKGKNLHFGVKLVRGAYMEKERERSHKMNYPDPIQPSKEATDKDFDRAVSYAMDHIADFEICLGTHNETSTAYLAKLMSEKKVSNQDKRIHFAQLLGMSDNISHALSDAGYNTAKYVPYGPLEKVLPYLFRRAEENTSVAGQTGRELQLIYKEIKRRKNIKEKRQ